MPGSFILVSREDNVATVTIARAERRNAITAAMMRDLERVSRAFADDERTRAVIFRAEGRDFSVGADLQAPPSRAAEGTSMLMRRRGAELGASLLRAIQEIPQPTICAVQGIATGAGACIASACDFRLAAADARIGYGEVKLAMNLMWTALPICVRLRGPARAKQMIMTGKLFDAAALERWGFLDEVISPDVLGVRTRVMAGDYAALPPIAVQMIKRSVDAVSGALDRAIMHMDADQWLLTSMTNDYREAVAAFLEKRPATFKGD
jgi:enoyl-CoA hydratase/carnithine racemase